MRPLLLILVACAASWISLDEADRIRPRLVVLDVGQGDALYLRTPAGHDLLIDTGPGRRVVEALEHEMPRGDRTLEAVILTHLDADHSGGAAAIFESFSVAQLYTNGDQPKSEVATRAIDTAVSRGVNIQTLTRGQQLASDGLILEVVWPTTADAFEAGNDRSVVMRVRSGAKTLLLMGDAPSKVEKALISQHTWLAAEVLKVGHHGSKTSTDVGLLSALVSGPAPDGGRQALISVGATNRYGHPTQEVLDRLAVFGMRVNRTDQEGTLTVPL